MNSVFELLLKVWTGSRDLKVSFGFDLILLFADLLLFSIYTLYKQHCPTDMSKLYMFGYAYYAWTSKIVFCTIVRNTYVPIKLIHFDKFVHINCSV